MEKNKTTIIAIVVALGVVGYYLFSSSFQTPTESSDKNQSAQTDLSADVSVSQDQTSPIKEFTVTGQNFSFSPTTINVNKGDKVKITFKNAEGTHDFVIDEFNTATKRLKVGEEETIEFTADKSGTFEYYCSVGTHRAMGMVGSLTVK